MNSKNKIGKIILSPNINVWAHELDTAKALAKAGFVVDFQKNTNKDFVKSFDILMDGMGWEIKSPRSSRLRAIESNLKKACRQSANIVFDSKRMSNLPDASIKKELIKQAKLAKSIKNLLLVNRRREVVDIIKLI